MQYTIRFLLTLTTLIAVLAFHAAFLSQTTYFISCAIIPAILALTVRHGQHVDHGMASWVAVGSAIIIGSVLLAYGSYDQTFHQEAKGFLVGDGWTSVGAAAIVGALAGFVLGFIALAIYFAISVVIGKLGSSSPD